MAEILTKRPYLIRAIFDWALDNGLTPQVLVNTTIAGVKIPAGHAPEGKITLNIHPQAVQSLELGKEWIMFSARFSGRQFGIELPVAAVMAIFARENGQGFVFQEEAGTTPDSPEPPPSTTPLSRKGPALKIVK